MMGILGWSWKATKELTLWQLVEAYEAKIVTDWDYASSVKATIYNSSLMVASASAGKRVGRPRSSLDFHPYRPNKQTRNRVTASNIGVLKLVAQSLLRSK